MCPALPVECKRKFKTNISNFKSNTIFKKITQGPVPKKNLSQFGLAICPAKALLYRLETI